MLHRIGKDALQVASFFRHISVRAIGGGYVRSEIIVTPDILIGVPLIGAENIEYCVQ